MKELEWREDMTVGEKVDAGFKLMVETFKEVFRKMDLQQSEMREFRQYVGKKFADVNDRFSKIDERFQKVDERFDKMDGRFDKMDGRNETRFQQLESSVMMVSGQVRRVENEVKSSAENIAVIKLDVKDLHGRLDGLATTVDRHDSELMKLKRVVGA